MGPHPIGRGEDVLAWTAAAAGGQKGRDGARRASATCVEGVDCGAGPLAGVGVGLAPDPPLEYPGPLVVPLCVANLGGMAWSI